MQDFMRNDTKQCALFCAILSLTSFAQASNLSSGHPTVAVGGYWSSQGESQSININASKGDYFTVTDGNGRNGLVGVGYFLNSTDYDYFELSHGLNFFYLPKTSVSGQVIQEQRYNNLAYSYTITHYPLYVTSQVKLTPETLPYALNMNIGIGPNFISTGNFTEKSIRTNSVPHNAFIGDSQVTFSATAGMALEFNALNTYALACGYRFFYLGKGTFTKQTNQILTDLSTGSNYANAIICGVTF